MYTKMYLIYLTYFNHFNFRVHRTFDDIYNLYLQLEKRQHLKMTACLLLRDEFDSLDASSCRAGGEKIIQRCHTKYIEWARIMVLANRQISKLHCRCPRSFARTQASLIVPPAEMPNKYVDFQDWFMRNSTSHHTTLASDTDSDLTVLLYQTANDVISDSDATPPSPRHYQTANDVISDSDATPPSPDTDTFSATIVASHADMMDDVPAHTGRCQILSSTPVPPTLFSDTIVASHANMFTKGVNVDVSHVSDSALPDDDVTMDDTVHVFREMSVTLVPDSCLMDITYTINFGADDDDDVTMQDAQDDDETMMDTS